MHKKSPRGIPDFSRHKPTPRDARANEPTPDERQAPPPTPRATVKPHATNAKSGRRGQ
ncbi:hypothetical protein J421_1113 [Gemmatirosa kalamazoonensis]|uniref:Uncharacterized protein n=1 Tax=Gemmatirosa kalamazoonensis TaxID=861299 RepID=W0RE92_9BACT|nr:hypothetical protein [Gemmatirosa kalamazoonensis]AHG88650.1 hypothetical protein J421_1113 [Gemmatirosa kalamazoonensis]